MEIDFIKCSGKTDNDGISAVISENAPENSYLYTVYTYKVSCGELKEIEDIPHLLEARVFSDKAELKLTRSTIDKEFCWRLIDDDDFKDKLNGIDDPFDGDFDKRTLDEKHFLDIDRTKINFENPLEYTATGGGKYTLPVENAEKIKIRNYISYAENGLAKTVDFRIVEIRGGASV